jgi:hypothetical protein
MRRRIIKKLQYQRMPFEGLLHDSALYACTAAMDDSHFAKAGGVSLIQVLCDHRRDIAGREGVKIEGALDWNTERVLILHCQDLAVFS